MNVSFFLTIFNFKISKISKKKKKEEECEYFSLFLKREINGNE